MGAPQKTDTEKVNSLMTGKILLSNVRKSILYERTLVTQNIEQNLEHKLDGQTDLILN